MQKGIHVTEAQEAIVVALETKNFERVEQEPILDGQPTKVERALNHVNYVGLK